MRKSNKQKGPDEWTISVSYTHLAIALAADPDILFADEPTTALDVTIQAQILDLLREIQMKLGTATILVSHDLGVVARVADRVAVMYAGKIVEIGTAEEVYYDPRHPYTWGLMRSCLLYTSYPIISKRLEETQLPESGWRLQCGTNVFSFWTPSDYFCFPVPG